MRGRPDDDGAMSGLYASGAGFHPSSSRLGRNR